MNPNEIIATVLRQREMAYVESQEGFFLQLQHQYVNYSISISVVGEVCSINYKTTTSISGDHMRVAMEFITRYNNEAPEGDGFYLNQQGIIGFRSVTCIRQNTAIEPLISYMYEASHQMWRMGITSLVDVLRKIKSPSEGARSLVSNTRTL